MLSCLWLHPLWCLPLKTPQAHDKSSGGILWVGELDHFHFSYVLKDKHSALHFHSKSVVLLVAASTLVLATKFSTYLPFYPSSTASCTLQHTVSSTDFMARWHRLHMYQFVREPAGAKSGTMNHGTFNKFRFRFHPESSGEPRKKHKKQLLLSINEPRQTAKMLAARKLFTPLRSNLFDRTYLSIPAFPVPNRSRHLRRSCSSR